MFCRSWIGKRARKNKVGIEKKEKKSGQWMSQEVKYTEVKSNYLEKAMQLFGECPFHQSTVL